MTFVIVYVITLVATTHCSLSTSKLIETGKETWNTGHPLKAWSGTCSFLAKSLEAGDFWCFLYHLEMVPKWYLKRQLGFENIVCQTTRIKLLVHLCEWKKNIQILQVISELFYETGQPVWANEQLRLNQNVTRLYSLMSLVLSIQLYWQHPQILSYTTDKQSQPLHLVLHSVMSRADAACCILFLFTPVK